MQQEIERENEQKTKKQEAAGQLCIYVCMYVRRITMICLICMFAFAILFFLSLSHSLTLSLSAAAEEELLRLPSHSLFLSHSLLSPSFSLILTHSPSLSLTPSHIHSRLSLILTHSHSLHPFSRSLTLSHPLSRSHSLSLSTASSWASFSCLSCSFTRSFSACSVGLWDYRFI